MKTLELFAGTGSFSNVAKERGHSIFRVELNKEFEAELHKDIFNVNIDDLPKNIDVVWASPPCTFFSVASIGKHWNKDNTPKTKEAELGMRLIIKTLELIKEINPKYVFIENPRGKLRKLKLIDYQLNTITYCQYGDNRMKPTDIWTNCTGWKPKPMCKNGDNCHVSAPRGSRTGTQGLKNAKFRSIIPKELIKEIIKECEKFTSF